MIIVERRDVLAHSGTLPTDLSYSLVKKASKTRKKVERFLPEIKSDLRHILA